MTERLILLLAADPPRSSDAPEVAEAKACSAVAAWCDLLKKRGERVTFGGLLTAGKAGAA